MSVVRPILLGICAAFFFAFTFILNRSMELSGGNWLWSASLRYFFMVPLLVIIVIVRKKMGTMISVMKEHPIQWLWWSFVGFGLFYAPLCFAAAYSPGWLMAGTWQITIISGSLLVPLFYETVQTVNGPIKVRGKIPYKGLMMSLIILLGIVLMQLERATSLSTLDMLLGFLPVLIASFTYPLGNRKMMEVCNGRLDAYERVLGMTLASLPFWILLSVYAWATDGLPSSSQLTQSFFVALCSGVFATVLFFKATDLVRDDMSKLGAVEATQSIAVLFTLAGEVLFLSMSLPSMISWFGIALVMVGMTLHSYVSRSPQSLSMPKKKKPLEL
ncbi:drug/metabolite transporter (DMT)-like permease [Bacillus iocasae]|uniref:Drug/metabolite transporter (DMT)-like permease n=1 Tax=Priestia iocasae TaxID=2291674 RepID=A0ABS2QWC4_9BACI|nr:drug/metabolite transporter (DMT)-like permease [Metabacillus iocasae]